MRASMTSKTPAVVFSLALMLLSSGCETVQNVRPRNPALTAREPLGPSFQDLMDSFLEGKLPEQTDSAQPSQPATSTQTR